MMEAQLTCPTCNEEKALRRAHLRTIDYPNLLFRRRPYRCLICNRRFYSRRHHLPATKSDASATQR